MRFTAANVRWFRWFHQSVIIGSAVATVTAGCGKSTAEKVLPQTDDANPITSITVGQIANYEGDAAALGEAVGGFGFGHQKSYSLSVPENMIVSYRENMASTACLEPLEADGPFVTLIGSDGSTISNDKVRLGDAAVSSFDFNKELAAGTYQVVVGFYATGESCGANLEFLFEKAAGTTNPSPGPGPGPAPGPNPNPNPGPSSPQFDIALVGDWEYSESADQFQLSQRLSIKADMTAVQTIKVNDEVFVDHDLEVVAQEAAGQKRLKLRITNVRSDTTDEPMLAGSELACIYELLPGKLHLNCALSAEGFPADFTDGVVFNKGFSTPGPVPVPTPMPGEITKEFTNIDLAIPDANNTGVSFPIDVTDDVKIKAVVLQIALTHTYVGDLRIRLQHPDGRIVLVRAPSGGSQNNLTITYGEGFTAPDGDFALFNDLSSVGVWKLIVSDEASDDVGRLTAVTLKIKH